MSVESLKKVISKKLIFDVPSLYFLLNTACRMEFGKDFLDTLFSSPRSIYSILKRLYGDTAAKLLFRTYFLEPVIQELSEAEREKVIYLLNQGMYLEAFEVLTGLLEREGCGGR